MRGVVTVSLMVAGPSVVQDGGPASGADAALLVQDSAR
jgi:hypothetical protein